MEQDLRRIDPGSFSLDDEGKERTGRIDIRYATTGGKHVIVELKRYGRRIDVDELYEQGEKYAVALRDVLKNKGENFASIEVVFVLGNQPTGRRHGLQSEEAYIQSRLAAINGRYELYDALISNTKKQYADYLEASEKASKLDAVLDSLKDAD